MAKRRHGDDDLVYSTDPERMRRAAGKAADPPPLVDGRVRVRRETRGRKGKIVTTVSGVPLNALELAMLAKELKRSCGSGGTVKDGVIEIQGDHADAVASLLAGRGWDVKRAGG